MGAGGPGQRPTPRTLAVVEHSAEGLLELQFAEMMLARRWPGSPPRRRRTADIARLTGIAEELEASAEGDAATVLDIAARFDQAVNDIAGNRRDHALYRTAEVSAATAASVGRAHVDGPPRPRPAPPAAAPCAGRGAGGA